jgi:hypothetical protein
MKGRTRGPMSAYQEYVERLCKRKPSLLNLCQFLSVPSSDHEPCRVVSLDFFEHCNTPIQTELDYDGLYLALKEYGAEETMESECDLESAIKAEAWNKRQKIEGRILLIEDIDKRTIEHLGSRLDIDPMFFAGHLHSPWKGHGSQVPEQSLLPSQSRGKQFVNIHHHRIILFDKVPPAKKLLRRASVDRKVVVTPLSNDQHIGIVQHCCSVWLAKNKTCWLGTFRKALRGNS